MNDFICLYSTKLNIRVLSWIQNYIFFLWCLEFEPQILHILCIVLTNWVKLTGTNAKIHLQLEITYPKSVIFTWSLLKTSTTIFKSNSKSRLSNCITLTQLVAWYRTRASHNSIVHTEDIHKFFFFASTNAPSSSRKQIALRVLFY